MKKLLSLLTLLLLLPGCIKLLPGPQTGNSHTLNVSVLFSEGGRGDHGYNDMAHLGVEQVKADFGSAVTIKYFDFTANYDFLLRLQGQSSMDVVIIIGGYNYIDSIIKIAKEFPKTRFVVVDGYISGLTEHDNITCINFKVQEGSFLVGAMAALKSTSGKIGFIGGIKRPEIERFETGFTAGAKYIKPEIKIIADYIGNTLASFKNFEKGEELAEEQYKNGVDVIFHAAGASGFGVISVAEKQKKWVIGVDTDQALLLPTDQRPYILTSMIKKVDTAVYNAIAASINKEIKGGYITYGLAENSVGYAENQYNAVEIKESKETVEKIKAKIIAKEIIIPDRTGSPFVTQGSLVE